MKYGRLGLQLEGSERRQNTLHHSIHERLTTSPRMVPPVTLLRTLPPLPSIPFKLCLPPCRPCFLPLATSPCETREVPRQRMLEQGNEEKGKGGDTENVSKNLT